MEDWACGGQWNRMVQFLAVLVQTVQSVNMELAVFFNGCLEQQRMYEWIIAQQRNRQKINQVLKHITNKGTPPPKIWWTSPVCLRTCLRMALRHLGVSVLCTMDDHHQEVIGYCREYGFHGLVADDGEYAVFDPPRYFSSEQLKLTYKGSLETKEYNLTQVAKGLNLSPDRFFVLAALLGNYLLTEQDLNDFYRKLGVTQGHARGPATSSARSSEYEYSEYSHSPSLRLEARNTSTHIALVCGSKLGIRVPPEVFVKNIATFVKNLSSVDNLDSVATQVFGSALDKRAPKLKQSVQYYLNGTKDGFLRYRLQATGRHGDSSGQSKQSTNKGKKNEEDLDTSKFASETLESERESLLAYREATAHAPAPQIVIDPPSHVVDIDTRKSHNQDSLSTGLPPTADEHCPETLLSFLSGLPPAADEHCPEILLSFLSGLPPAADEHCPETLLYFLSGLPPAADEHCPETLLSFLSGLPPAADEHCLETLLYFLSGLPPAADEHCPETLLSFLLGLPPATDEHCPETLLYFLSGLPPAVDEHCPETLLYFLSGLPPAPDEHCPEILLSFLSGLPPAADEHCLETLLYFLLWLPPAAEEHCPETLLYFLSGMPPAADEHCPDTHMLPFFSIRPAMNGGSGHTSNLLISSSSSSSSSSATSPTPETCKISPSEDISPASPKMNLPVVAPEVMRTASERHQKGLMSPYIYQILTQGEMKLPVLLEDENHKEFPSIHLLYRPVRQMVYAILFNLHHYMYMATKGKDKAVRTEKSEVPDLRVREWVWSKNNPYQSPDMVKAEQIGWGVPTIQRLWFGGSIDDKRRRLRAFLTCMRSDTPLMLNPAYVPQHLLVMATVLRYIMSCNKPVLRKPELDAIIVQAFSPELMNAQYLQELQVQVISARGAQLAALFMQGVETALLANDACGAPIPWLMCCPWLFFDGKLFHHKLERTSHVKNLLELCDHRIEHVVKVERMRKAVLEGIDIQFARPPLPVMQMSGPGVGGSSLRLGLPPPSGGPLNQPRSLLGGRGISYASNGVSRGLLRRPVPARGGQLEIAGVVVGSWGPNYGSRVPLVTSKGVRLGPQVTSIGGLKSYRQGGLAVQPFGGAPNRPTYHTRTATKNSGAGRGKKKEGGGKKKNSLVGNKKIIQREVKGRGLTVEGQDSLVVGNGPVVNDVVSSGDEQGPTNKPPASSPDQFEDALTTLPSFETSPSDTVEPHKGQGDGPSTILLASN
uniref:Uncharacterized protein n=2 Tax=Timema TaxID=61471 RepID=A0A7R9I6F1_9NEOP|nr:unnamed protein product [Timema bartmani]